MVWFLGLAVASLAVVETVGDALVKYSGSNPDRYVMLGWLFLGMFVYAMAAAGWFFVFKHVKLGSIGMIYALTTVVSLSVFGMVVFGETYTKAEIFGMLLGFCSIILLARAP